LKLYLFTSRSRAKSWSEKRIVSAAPFRDRPSPELAQPGRAGHRPAGPLTVDSAIADVLLDCVGVSQTAAFLHRDPGEWDRVIAVNLTGMFHLGQQAARQMVRQGAGGSIINVTSQLAEVAAPSVPPMSPRRAAAGR
jgi:NAD(P)-dependent dehydrogenase (short-subunit alcohol dehydrogenase family)